MKDDQLLADVQSWLDRNGYVLEMEVARAAKDSGAISFQGDSIEDPETGKLREQDVLARPSTGAATWVKPG